MKVLIFMAVLVLGSSCVWAQTSAHWVADKSQSQVHFFLKSTLHDAEGVVGDWESFFDQDPTTLQISGEGVFQVASMQTGNKKRDAKMRQMFEADQFPKIVYRFEDVRIPEGDDVVMTLPGRLRIKDLTRIFPINVRVVRKDREIILSGEADISLSIFQLKPPSVMGVIKVNDIVHVKFDIVYQQP